MKWSAIKVFGFLKLEEKKKDDGQVEKKTVIQDYHQRHSYKN
jgi:hypothetical protein